MRRIYYSRQNYNQRKRKQYEEYLKRLNKYYLYKKKCHEEYLKRQIKYYLYKKKCYEEYLKRQNEYYSYKEKYDKIDTSQSELFNSLITGSREDNNIKDNSIKNNNRGSLETNVKEKSLEYKKDDSAQYDKLENNNCTSIEDSYKEGFLVGNDKEFSDKDHDTVAKEELLKENNIPTGGVYVKLPVILAETNVTIPVEATITLDQAVMEIKRIKKNVFLTQSRLIPFSSNTVSPNSGILFIEGFIRKNFEYQAQTCVAATANICGNVRHCIVEVPFNFTTRITFLRPPIFIKNITTSSQLEFCTDKLQICDSCADKVLGCNPCEQSFVFSEVFNEKPYVELVEATFTEVDIHKNPILRQETHVERMFTQITEKIIVNLTLKVLQNQQVRVIVGE